MEGDHISINSALLPLSWLYGVGVRFRNFLFDVGILKSRAFSVPVIAVGNLTVGGTGKTPHVEYLVRLLQDKAKVAILSRGYKRKTKGYLLASAHTTAQDIGDEPFQMKQKFPKASVAVCKKRVEGIERLTRDDHELAAIVLDDAFQHRYVKPGVNILLVDYHRLVIYDRLLPAGRLREPLSGKNRADIVIVTKCPAELRPMDYRVITKAMDLYPYQQLFFTTFTYDALRPVFPAQGARSGGMTLGQLGAGRPVLLLTGIASPRQMLADVERITGTKPATLTFSDHHNFKKKDVALINDTFASMPQQAVIITTEKDAVRLQQAEGLSDQVRGALYALPVRVAFMLEQEEQFNEKIIGYVRKNSKNSILAQRKDDHKSKDGHRPGDRPRTISFRNN
ncbi:MAG: tetraacyldisaccharide 4'-kinase [Prevotella sp.]|nr:tetraacyldisaccharide 4'-kinase [Prevotella sp.]